MRPIERTDKLDPTDALMVLENRFLIDNGIIRPLDESTTPTEMEWEAIFHLVRYWTYGYDWLLKK